MHHLALPFYCAVIVGALKALLARAIYTSSDTFALIALVGIGYFGPACVIEIRRCWPAYRAEMQRRTDERRRRAMPADDTH